MGAFRDALHAFFTSPTGTAAYGVLIVAGLDWLLGTLKSVSDGTFTLSELAAFLRKHIAGRVLPIWAILIFGYLGGIEALVQAGLLGAAAYVAETVGSILTDWAPPSVRDKIAALTSSLHGNPVPTD